MLTIHNLSKKFAGNDFYSLKNVNLEINKGEIVGLIGKNGAGKSTLMKLIAKSLKPTEGEIYYNEVELSSKDCLLQDVGIMIDPVFYPEMTVEDNLKFYLRLHNKKELYFFLFDLLVQQTENVLKEGGCYETLDFFELFKSVTQTKVQLARLNPDWLAFSLKTYYEQDPEIMPELAQRMKQVKAKQVQLMDKLDMSCFRPDIDFQLMYKDMTWAAQGYLWEHVQRGSVDPETIEAEFNQLIDFWKSLYLRKE